MKYSSLQHKITIGIAFFCLVIASCSPNSELAQNESASEETENISEEEPAQDETFPEAVRKATEASSLTQVAQSPEQWADVAIAWRQAAELMKEVPESSSNYEVAQAKFPEYKSNETYARSNISPSEIPLDQALEAISTDNIEELDALLDQGFDPNYVSPLSNIVGGKRYVLTHASKFGSDAHVKRLIEAGATWDPIPSEELGDALVSASCAGQPFTVKELLAAGADPNYENFSDETPLAMANSGICQAVDKNGEPLQPGQSDHGEVIQLLRAAGATR